MNEQETIKFTREQEEELVNILIGSSLYLGISETNRETLLQYLVATYFNPLPGENSRALPKAIQSVPATSIETH
jgi:hypothetical protein